MSYRTLQRIRFDDVDGAGIVYYPRFFHICHKTFEDWFNDCGPVSYPTLIAKNSRGFPTVAISSEFISPLLYGDEATIEVAVKKIGNTSLICHYGIYKQKNVLCFSALITTVHIDLKTKKPVSISPDLRVFFEKYYA